MAAYVIAHLISDFISGSFKIHFGQDFFAILSEKLEQLVEGVALLACN
jgi:hypothetical protein